MLLIVGLLIGFAPENPLLVEARHEIDNLRQQLDISKKGGSD